MTRSSILSAALFATTALTSPAAADITPAEVWQDLRSYMEGVGYTVSGVETGGGDQLTVSDVVMESLLPEEGGKIIMELGTITLTDLGEAVSVGFEEVMPIRFDVETEPGSRAAGTVEYRQTGLDMQVTGSVGTPRYAYSADALDLAITDLTVDGTEIGRDAVRMTLSMADVRGSSLSNIGAVRDLDQSFSAGSVDYDFHFSDTDGGANLGQIVGKMANMTMTAETEMPLSFSGAPTPNPFAMGVLADVVVSHEGGAFNLNATENGNTTGYAATSESGSFAFDMTETSLGYDVTSRGASIQLASSDLPFPVALEAEETTFSLSGPVRPTETAEDFSLVMALRGFEMAEMLWNIFDPGNALPRDPATLEVDISGEMRQLIDFLDEDQVMRLEEDDVPSELHSLSLNALTLDVAGALLTGSGAFTFDNNDLTTFDGFPAPDGELTLELTGANQLIDRLVSMGMLPADQAMGARMMMTMFARPTGDDVLSSKIEVRSDGRIIANGQRLQ